MLKKLNAAKYQFLPAFILALAMALAGASYVLAQAPSWGGASNPLTVFEVNDCFGSNQQTTQQENLPCQSYNADLYEALQYGVNSPPDAPYADITILRVGADATYLYIEWDVNATVISNNTHDYIVEIDVDPDTEIVGSGATAGPIGDNYIGIQNKSSLFGTTWKDPAGDLIAHYDSNDDVGRSHPLTGDSTCTLCPEASGGNVGSHNGYNADLAMGSGQGYFARINADSVQLAIPWTKLRRTANNHALLAGRPNFFRVRGWTSQSSSLDKSKLQFHDAEPFSQIASGGRRIDNTTWGTNQQETGSSITIIKDTVPNNAQDFTFTTSGGLSLGTFTLDDDTNATLTNTITFNNILTGTYVISEATVSGWALTNIVCNDPDSGTTTHLTTRAATIDVDLGEAITCIYTNTQTPNRSITIIKDAVPNASQVFAFTTSTLSTFTLDDDNGTPLSNTKMFTSNVIANNTTYIITETAISGWQLTNIACNASGSNASVTPNVASRTVTVNSGSNGQIVCIFTNNRKAQVKVVKELTPETDPGLFNLQVNGTTELPDAGDGDDTGFVNVDNLSGNTVGETAGTDTTQPDYESAISCDNGDAGAGVSLTLSDLNFGDQVTCTITNTKLGSLTLIKDAAPADGADFDFTIKGPVDLSPFINEFHYDNLGADTGEFIEVAGVAGTDLSGWSLVLYNGDNRQSYSPTINLIGIIDDEISGFGALNFAASGLQNGPPDGMALIDPSNNVVQFISYEGSFTANNGPANGLTSTDVGVAETTSTPVGESLQLTGTGSAAAEFTWSGPATASPGDLNGGQTLTFQTSTTFTLDDESTQPNDSIEQSITFDHLALGNYTVTEQLPGGWQLEGVACAGGSGDFFDLTGEALSVTLGAGETVTCTFTNEQDGKIVVIKETNPDGSSQVFNFSASYDTDGFSLSDGQSNSSGNLDPGVYSVSETVPSGWALTSATCDDGSDANIVLDPGETVTCTFTNSKNGTIRIVKHIVPDNASGTFNFESDDFGNFSLSGDFDFEEFSVPYSANAVSYVFEEVAIPGWDLTSVVCDDATGDSSAVGATLTVKVTGGEFVRCIYTNTQRGELTIIKQVNWSGLTPNSNQSFELCLTGPSHPSGFCGTIFPSTVNGLGAFGVSNLLPGDYIVSETDPGAAWMVSGSGQTVTVPSGGTVEATIVNTRKTGSLQVVKNVVPDTDDGLFNLLIDGNPEATDVGDGGSTGAVIVDIGAHTVGESAGTDTDLANYQVEIGGDCDPDGSITLGAGQNATCVITNTKRGHIVVNKQTIGGNGSFAFSASYDGDGFTLSDGDSNDSGPLASGSYSVSETVPAGWDLTSAICNDGNSPATISLQAAQTVTCVFTNTQRGLITIIKDAVPDDNQIFDFGGDLGNFSLVDNGLVPNFTTFSNLTPGLYSVSETVPAGWDLTGLNCNDLNGSANLNTATATINLDSGETVTCTFTNDPLPAITVTKTASPTSVNEPGGVVTFTVSVDNDSVEAITLDSLTDTVHGDLNGQGDCATGGTIVVGGSYTCSFTATISGNAGDSETDVVTAIASDDDGNEATANDDAVVTIADIASSILVAKTADPTEVAEPGGSVNFTVRVDNTSVVDSMTIDSLSDNIHGDLDGQGDCAVPQTLAAGDFYECSFSASVTGNAGESETDMVTVTGTDDDGNSVSDNDDATVTITNVAPTITVNKTADPNSLLEPGGTIQFTVEVSNFSNEDVTLTSLVDVPFGDLTDNLNPAISNSTCVTGGTIVANGGAYSCTFEAEVTGEPGLYTDRVTATAQDNDGTQDSDNDDATVTITDVSSSILVTKTADPTEVAEPGGSVNFIVRVDNTSAGDSVTIDTLSDSIHSDLDGQGDCAVPQTIAAGDFYECTFSATTSGNAGDFETDVVTASGIDDDGNPVSDDDDATVTITDTLPDITVQKDNDANGDTTFTDNEQTNPGETVTFQVTITNNTDEEVTIDSISDSIYDLTGSDCASLTGTTLAANGSVTCTFTGTLANQFNLLEVNEVTVVARDDEGNTGEAKDTSTVTTFAPGSITIIKEAEPEGNQVFNFNGTLGSFNLVDDGDGPSQGASTFANLGVGNYTVGEQVSNRWVLLSISCSSNQREPFSVAFPAMEITIAGLQPGEAVSCTFTNNKPNFEEEPTTIYLPLIVK